MRVEGPAAEAQVLVVGAGLAGMTAAHHVAEWGAQVTLVDSAPHIGGAFLLLDHTFTTDSCGLCMALPRQPSTCPTIASRDHPRITPLTRATLIGLEGEPGRFTATLLRGPRYVDPERCDGCGVCAESCPVTRPDVDGSTGSLGEVPRLHWAPAGDKLAAGALIRSRWGRFLEADPLRRKAIYAPPARAVPTAYVIDPDACLGTGVNAQCRACVAACPQDAIDLGAMGGVEEVGVGAIVLAPGFTAFDAAQALEYGYGRCANVVTSLEFERMLNRSGPTGGRIRRPSDGRVPQRIGFIHCVGSRSEALGRPYCSSSCCMITAKQVGLTKEVAAEAAITVFTMDVRTGGKGYERYFQRVADLPGVTYRRERPAAVHCLPGTRDLRLLTSHGEEVVELLVLAVGMGPSEGVKKLAAGAGVAVDEHGFVLMGEAGPGSTSRAGVFCAGSGVAPTDVPETVTQAGAAAALAVEALRPASHAGLSEAGDTALRSSVTAAPGGGPGETVGEGAQDSCPGVTDQPQRIGVFLCTCHGDLNERLDLAALSIAAEGLRGVRHVERVEEACDPSGLRAIERSVEGHELNRVVIAGCSPHLHTDRLEGVMARLGLPARLHSRANIREGAAWPHGRDVVAATSVARGEIAMAVAALRDTDGRPVNLRGLGDSVERVLVLGGGLAGMTAALTLAELGVNCDLVEREADLGGNLRETLHTLEGLDGQRLLRETAGRLEEQPGVRLWTEGQLVGWSGAQGDFRAEISTSSGMRLERYGALIVATGAKAATTSEYGYGQHEHVVTQRELERQIAGWSKGSGLGPRSVVMIQCVGSREDEGRSGLALWSGAGGGRPYCSRVCCAHAIKNALDLKALDPDIEVSVLFRDIRTMGTQELHYGEARRLGVQFLRYEPPRRPVVDPRGDGLRVTVHDTLYDDTLTLDADLVVLSTGIAPCSGNRALAQLLGVELDEDGFFAEAHPKLRPTDLPKPGLFLCGMAYGPRFITESIGQAQAAAVRAALSVLRPPGPRREAVTVEPKLCSFCGLCVATCPYGARVLDYEERVARVIDYLCQGCGACVALCPNGATRQPAFEPARALAVVDAALD